MADVAESSQQAQARGTKPLKTLALLLSELNPGTGFVGGRGPLGLAARAWDGKATVRSGPVHMQGVIGEDFKTVLAANKGAVDSLGSIAPDMSELTRLRYVLAFDEKAVQERNVRDTVAWRAGKGKAIVDAAAAAVAEAQSGGAWNNEPVIKAAPNSQKISKYITPKNILTLSADSGDLVYVIRASAIDDKALMDEVSVEELTDFLIYAKEVHNLIANARTEKTGRLCRVIFANDVSGIRKPPDSRFQKTLTESSKGYEKLYPSLAGPTMILNLPFILQAFIALFKPLFPKTVQARLKFERAPYLAKMTDMSKLATDSSAKTSFLSELTGLVSPR